MHTHTNSGFLSYKPDNRIYATKNRKMMTKAEGLLWHMLLKNKQTGYRFLRQKPIGKYIVDFYCSQLLLVIEVDGASHEYTETHDKTRSHYLDKLGVKIVRYTNAQIYNELVYVFNHLVRTLTERAEELKTE